MLENRKHQPVFIVGDTIDGQLSTGIRQLGPKARDVAALFDGCAVGILTGHHIEAAARKWSELSGMSVVALENEHCRFPNPPATAAGVASLAKECPPAAVCFPHNMRFSQAAAELAWRLEVPCITAVESLTRQGTGIELKRMVHGGRLIADVCVDTFPLVLTVMPGFLPDPHAVCQTGDAPSTNMRPLPATDHRFVPLSVAPPLRTDQTLEKARVIVAGGRGLGEAEQVRQLEKTAGLFKDAAVGASRGACDLGWLPHSRQIGETGRTVAPALYLACGISGAPQHLAGMHESRTIVAVNTDSQAAIRNVAHYALEEDLKTFLPLLRERYKQTFTKGEANEDR